MLWRPQTLKICVLCDAHRRTKHFSLLKRKSKCVSKHFKLSFKDNISDFAYFTAAILLFLDFTSDAFSAGLQSAAYHVLKEAEDLKRRDA